MDYKSLPPTNDEQITTRLQNAARGVLLELESQGVALAEVSGSYTVSIVAGEISVNPVNAGVRTGKTKFAADAAPAAEIRSRNAAETE